jgi:hypothetical protein
VTGTKDPNFKADSGVLPPPGQTKAGGIDIVDTGAQHDDMSDRGPDSVKEKIQVTLDRFLRDSASSELALANNICKPGDY